MIFYKIFGYLFFVTFVAAQSESESCLTRCKILFSCKEDQICKQQNDNVDAHCDKLDYGCKQKILKNYSKQSSQKTLFFVRCAQFCENYEQFQENNYDFAQIQSKKIAYVPKDHPIRMAFEHRKNWIVFQSKMGGNTNWDFKWSFKETDFSFEKNSSRLQAANKIPKMQNIIGNKKKFLELLVELDTQEKSIKNYPDMSSDHYIPETYNIPLKEKSYSQEILDLFDSNRQYWITKTPSGLGGTGCKVYKDLSEIKEIIDIVKTKFDEHKNTKKDEEDIIVQKYVENPLLIDQKKFDIRVFVLIASTDPWVVLFHHGYIRRTLGPYNKKVDDWDNDKYNHLTNTHMQENRKDYLDQIADTGMTMQQFNDYCVSYYKKSYKFMNNVWIKMKKILTYTFEGATQKLDKQGSIFQLTGNDFMMDDEFNLILLEINGGPRMKLDIPGENVTIPFIANSTVDIILQLNNDTKERRKEKIQNIEKEIDLFGWDVLINEATDYNYCDYEHEAEDIFDFKGELYNPDKYKVQETQEELEEEEVVVDDDSTGDKPYITDDL